MKIVRKIRKGDYELVHKKYIDDFGFARNYMVVVKTKPNGERLLKQLTPSIKHTKYPDMHDNIDPFTEKEYEEILEGNSDF